MVQHGNTEPSGEIPAGVYLNPIRFMASCSVAWKSVGPSDGNAGNREIERRGRAERSLRAGRTSVSVRSVDNSIWSGAGDEAACPPEMADCFRFLEGGCGRALGPGEFEKSRGGEDSALASMIVV